MTKLSDLLFIITALPLACAMCLLEWWERESEKHTKSDNELAGYK